jgi:hypothetical protein
MAVDSDFIKCRDGTYIARRLVTRIEVREDDRGMKEHVLFGDHGDEIGRTRADIFRPTLVAAVGWTHWLARFDPEDPGDKWTREAEPVVAWEVGGRGCRPIGASYGPLPLHNFASDDTHIFRYLEEARDGRRRYWATHFLYLRAYETIGELDAEIRRFIAAVRAKAAEGAEDE